MTNEMSFRLAEGDDKGFQDLLEQDESASRFEAVMGQAPDPSRLRRRYELDAMVKGFTGASSEEMRTRLPAASVMRQVFKSEEAFTPEAFDQAAREWGRGERKRSIMTKRAINSGFTSVVNRSPEELENQFQGFMEESPEAAEAFMRGKKAAESRMAEVLPVARSIVLSEKAEGQRGLFQEADESPEVDLRRVMKIYREGNRPFLLKAIQEISEKEGGEVSGSLTKFVKSAARTVEGMSEDIGRKLAINFGEGEADAIELAAQFQADIGDIKGAVAKIEGDYWVSTGIYDAAGSLPYMALMANPLGIAVAATATHEDHINQIQNESPDVTREQASRVALFSAGIEVGIEKMQYGLLKKVLPKAGGALLKKQFGKVFKTVAAGVGAEYAQETFQDATLPLVMDVSNLLSETNPQGNWDDFSAWDRRRFFAVLPLVVLGSGGNAVMQKLSLPEIKATMSDKDQLMMRGHTEKEAVDIVEIAKEDPVGALEAHRKMLETRPEQERNEMGEAAAKEIMQKAEDADTSALEGFPIVRPQESGEFLVDFRDGRTATARTEAEAQFKIDQWIEEESSTTLGAVNDLVGHFRERAEGENSVKQVKNLSLKDLAESGQERDADLKKAAAVYHAQMNEAVPEDINLADYKVNGAVKLKKRMAGYSVMLSEGADPLTVAEEFSEGFLRLAVQNGETTFEDVKGLLDEFGVSSGLEITQGYDVDPDRAVIEGFSKFAKAYLLQGKYDALPKESQAWMRKAWRVMENPSAISKKLKAAVDYFTSLLKSVFDVAKAIEFHRKDGDGINPDLEGLALRALGLDEKVYNERMEEAYRQEILDEVYDPAEELSVRVKGMIPHPSDLIGEPLQAEVQTIFDEMKRENRLRRKDGRRVLNDVKARNFFAKKGEGTPLDEVREYLNEQGFRFDTPAEMLDAVSDSIEGRKQWPEGSGLDQDLRSFSVGSTQVTPNAEAKFFPTKDGGFVGPASFSIQAYHGTPHKFEKFSTDKMGTGEGAQAFGYGLYFAESEGLAKSYRDTLSKAVDGVRKVPSHIKSILGEVDWLGFDSVGQALSEMRQDPDWVSTWEVDELTKGDIETINSYLLNGNEGFVYSVKIKADEDQFLDWDKPLSEQSEIVQTALKSIDPDLYDPAGDDYDGSEPGQITYSRLKGFDHDKSLALYKLGIKGIRYLDGNSRSSGEGSSNYVIFNDADIEITAENGKPVDLGASFSLGKSSITTEQDADYLKAVESGDMETAQEMVDEAAKKAGYGYSHRRRDGKDPRETGYVVMFAEDKNANSHYGPKDYVINESNAAPLPDWVVDWYLRTDEFQEIAEENEWDLDEQKAQAEASVNPVDIVNWGELWDRPDLVSLFWEENEDRLIDEGLVAFRTNDGVVMFDSYSSPSAIKSADPVTYDEAGNVIPLSKRFDETRDEISYQLGEKNGSQNLKEATELIFDGVGFHDRMSKAGRKAIEQARNEWREKSRGEGDELDLADAASSSLARLDALNQVLPDVMAPMKAEAQELTEDITREFQQAKGLKVKQVVGNEMRLLPFPTPKFLERFDISKWVQRNLTARGNLTREQFKIKLASEASNLAELKKAEQITDRLRKAVDKEVKGEVNRDQMMRQAHLVMVKQANEETIPESVRPIVEEGRKHVDAMSQEMIAAGIADGDLEAVFRRNMGSYLNRSYRRFTRPDEWKNEVSEEAKQGARQWLYDNLPPEAFSPDVGINDQLDGYVENLLNDSVSGSMADQMTALLGQQHLGNLIKRQAVPAELRALWGEYLRADENYLNSIRKMAGQVSNHTMLEQFKKDGLGSLIFDTPRKGHAKQITAEGNENLAPLDGYYVSEEMAEALEDFAEVSKKEIPTWLKWWLKFNSTAKVTKTIYNPTTHARNFFSNFLITLANGNILEYTRSGKGSLKINLREVFPMKTTQEIEDRVQYYVRLGVMHQGAVSQEFRDVLKDFSAGEIDVEEYSANKVKKFAKAGTDIIQAAYQAEDDFHKVVAFEAEKRKLTKAKPKWDAEKIDREAAQVVRDTMPDYSQVPQVVKGLRRLPLIGTFTSFTSEVIRNNIAMVARARHEMKDPDLRPIGVKRMSSLMFAHALPVAGIVAAKAMFGVDDEEDEATRAIAAPWDKDSMLVYTGRTPSGDPTYINIGYTDPFSIFKSPFIISQREGLSVTSVSKGILKGLEPFYGTEIGTKAMLEVSTNRTENGREVYNPNADLATQVKDASEHLLRALEPGVLKTAERISDAVTGKKTSTGVQRDLETEIFTVLSGQRITTSDRKKAIRFRSFDFQRANRAASERFNRAWRMNDASEDDLREAYGQFSEDRLEAHKDYQDALKAVSRLGLTNEEILLETNEGKDHTKGAKLAMALVQSKVGETPIPPKRLSRGQLKAIGEIEGRKEMLQKVAPELFEE